MKKPKILYIDTCHDVAGGQRSLIALIKFLNQHIEFNLLIDSRNKKYLKELLDNGVNRNNIKFINSKVLGSRLLGGIVLFMSVLFYSRTYSVIHCNTFFDGLFAMPAARLVGCKTIFRARCGLDLSNHGIVDRIIYKFSTVILSNSEYVRSTFNRISNNLDKIVTIYNPLDLKFLKQSDTSILQSDSEESNIYTIGIIGAITEVKNQNELVEAVSLTSNENIKIKIIGEPRSTDNDKLYYQNLLESIRLKNMNDRVEFTGFVSDVRSVLDDVDLVCVPSDREPLGRVIFESQLYEIPVLASSSGGNTELIKDNETGFLYPLGDVGVLSKKIDEIVRKKDMAHITKDAKDFVLSRFSPQNTYLAELELYKELMVEK